MKTYTREMLEWQSRVAWEEGFHAGEAFTRFALSDPIDWSPPKGERIGGVPPWQGGYLLERAA